MLHGVICIIALFKYIGGALVKELVSKDKLSKLCVVLSVLNVCSLAAHTLLKEARLSLAFRHSNGKIFHVTAMVQAS